MTQEIKDKLEQAAERITLAAYGHTDDTAGFYLVGIERGMKTILENPEQWGLVEKRLVDAGIQLRIETIKACEETHLQNEKYREALERIANEDDEPLGDVGIVEAKWIAKEALKQEVNSETNTNS